MSSPVEAFRSVAAAHERCFWLDGGGAREWSGRRSLVGWLEPDDVSLTYDAATRLVTRHAGGRAEVVGHDVFAVLEAELGSGSSSDQWFGYLGYACRPDLPASVGSGLPDAVWMRPSHVRLFDHETSEVSRQAPERLPQPPTSPPPTYAAAFERVQEQLRAGNTYEVNLTFRAEVASDLDPVTAYLRLRELNPAPYAGFVQHDVPGARAWLLSSSPERYALVGADRSLETKPIKGTTPRGDTPDEDERQRVRLATDPKMRAENLMIVDLLRNDLSLVCEPGTVEVPTLMEVETYESVHQLVSTVRGRLRPEVTTVQALRALFPAGSMTGAPKLRTMQVVEDVEETPRGPYAGAFGWISADGRADLGVVIRSLMTAGDGRYLLGTGGGITVRSDVGEEWAEAQWKADRLRRVFDTSSPGRHDAATRRV
ncbi:anthranilate synthase [Nocardioides sp. Root1257]|uniref:anthranilate synthase component I family protein n=1 Tax=unclassified Nocardioides TaxID=2615069 RepID=UPI0006F2FFCA|nr:MULTISPECIES: anthranilate synthase component I family protein [unclassified Nocardioides]KQW47814.1 anthranilate synthase [Nocardioides sp. Root1257]KRC45066.1 anthranilate synthase [Nocardioides sp. Root224]